MKALKNKITTFQLILVVCILLAGTFIRMEGLGKIPSGLTNDEANIGYDAYSILKTGKDQWGEKQPNTYFKGFGDYRPPIYTYTVVPSIAVFGLNEFAVRFPSAVAGSLTIVLVFLLALLLWENATIAIASMFLLAFNPWHIGMSRVGIEPTVAVFITTCALNLFLLSFSRKILIYPSLALFALSIYTYTSFVIWAPVFMIILFYCFRKNILINKKSLLIGLLIFIVILLPIFLGGNLKTASTRSGQVNLTGDTGLINIVNDKRGECQTNLKNRICQIFQNKYITFASVFVTNYLNHYSPELLATQGTPTQYSILPQRGFLYVWEYIFFVIGIFALLRQKQPQSLLILLWVLLAPLPDSITGSGHYSRFLPIVPAIQLTSTTGAYSMYLLFKKKRWIIMPVVPIALYSIISFLIVYSTYFPRFYATFSHYGYRDLMHFVKNHESQYDKIIISNRINDTKQYVFYLFFTKYNPSLYQSGKNVEKVSEQNGWIRIKRIGKVYFLPNADFSPEEIKKTLPHILLAGAPDEFPKKTKTLYSVKDPKNNVIFALVDINQNPEFLLKKQAQLLILQ
ncbi:MAG: hypothetical protein A2857_03525 [Candidatus Levybacteria bacterium RIFCSPHIGHO2_01_FULL_36_15]|nr:MAG: hypothetical protein A2857_03525 [Candidatus Levybacteria bacterium RIFCSPHIGHO2_01_FULL_36_15]OGH37874.1 MAG: hypothetical protein A2905_02135 [Candidatus Levybacteria bacterium RIFCSPLOWO2_01_FULL_36_10]